jgi:predicted nucleic acid-binding protein
MIAERFIDTNILLYAASADPEDRVRRGIARKALAEPGIGFSAQVLQEFYNAAVCKGRLEITHDEALLVMRSLAPFPVLPVTRELVLRAADIRQQYDLSYWDAAIIAAALALGCRTLVSEDFNAGQDYGGVVAVNPFA